MASTLINITDIAIDNSNDIWITGRDIHKFDGDKFLLYNFQNSAVPSNAPYFLDTRTISIDPNGDKWIGCATAPYVSDCAIFKLIGEYAQDSISWTFQDLGLSGQTWEVSKLYASPYGNEVLAFITDLNGGAGVTGSTGPSGVTGGYIFGYDQNFGEWKQVIVNYNWSHVYDIKAKGIDGDLYEYWVATDIGLIIIEGGNNMIEEPLFDFSSKIMKSRILNSLNSPLPSSIIYSIDFDEDHNLWIGTSNGLAFLSHDGNYTVWNSSNLPSLPSNEITIVKSVNNGQVFFTSGDGYRFNGNGIFYFDGNSLRNFNSFNSGLPNNNVTEIVSFWKKSKNLESTYYPNEILLACVNDFCLVDYIVPHIYASANFVGATGWSFTTYTPSDGIKLPRVDKYTWTYPSWRTYQDLYLQYKHPGMDKRNLFLTTDLSDIATGYAGRKEYWEKGPIPTYDEMEQSRSIGDYDWLKGITGATAPYFTGTLKVAKSKNRNVVALNFAADPNVNQLYAGKKADNTDVIIEKHNSVTTGSYSSTAGVIVYYNNTGQIEGSLTIRGNQTTIECIKFSPDERSLYVIGKYDSEIEIGEFVWGGGTGGGYSLGGPIGSPIGISNIDYPGITGQTSEYPWILSGYTGYTGPGPYFPPGYTPGMGNKGIYVLELDSDIGSTTSYDLIDFDIRYDLDRKYRVKKFRYFPYTNPFTSPDYFDAEITERSVRISYSSRPDSYYTLKNYMNWDDSISIGTSFGGDSVGDLSLQGFYLDMDRDLNLKNVYTSISGQSISLNSVSFYNISTEKANDTTILTGYLSNGSFDMFGKTIGIPNSLEGKYFYIVVDSFGNITSQGTSFSVTNSSSIGSASSHSNHYIFQSFIGPTGSVFGVDTDPIETSSGVAVVEMSIYGKKKLLGSYQIPQFEEYPTLTGVFVDSPIIKGGSIYSSYHNATGLTSGYSNVILKTDMNGSYPEIKLYGSPNYSMTRFDFDVDDYGSVFFAGNNLDGVTGPSDLPISSDDTFFVGFSKNHIPLIGKAKGQIISRSGTGAWRWSDFHRDEKNMEIPLLSTVFFSNYNSNIFGKKEYRWVLTDQKTGREILDVKKTPYFIYTFEEPGYYSLYNSVEDENGNVYEISKTAYIQVVNHKNKKADDPEPFAVNSYDYDYIQIRPDMQSKATELGRDMEKQAEQILKNMAVPFGSQIFIKDNPDATFRSRN